MSTTSPDVFLRSDGSVLFNSGQVLAQTHTAENCHGDVCTIHKPSAHALMGEQLFYNGKHMVRRVGDQLFVDPDDYFYLAYGKAILRNSAICAQCGDSIVSENRHHMNTCSCGAIFVDGGNEYLRRGARSWADLIDTSITVGDVS